MAEKRLVMSWVVFIRLEGVMHAVDERAVDWIPMGLCKQGGMCLDTSLCMLRCQADAVKHHNLPKDSEHSAIPCASQILACRSWLF